MSLEEGAPPLVIFSATAGVFELTGELAPQVGDVLEVDLQVLDLLDEFDVFLGEAGLVGGDVDDGAVELLDFDVEFVDGDFELLGMFDGDEFLLVDGLDLGEEFVDFGLEFAFFLLSPGEKEIIE